MHRFLPYRVGARQPSLTRSPHRPSFLVSQRPGPASTPAGPGHLRPCRCSDTTAVSASWVAARRGAGAKAFRGEELHVDTLVGDVRVIDLRRDRTLDALGIDDQINTSRAPGVWTACQRLADLLLQWYGDRLEGIVYRSRTTPQHSAHLAFFEHTPLIATGGGPLGDHTELLAACVASDGFVVEGW